MWSLPHRVVEVAWILPAQLSQLHLYGKAPPSPGEPPSPNECLLCYTAVAQADMCPSRALGGGLKALLQTHLGLDRDVSSPPGPAYTPQTHS